jgi:hypothetical protein
VESVVLSYFANECNLDSQVISGLQLYVTRCKETVFYFYLVTSGLQLRVNYLYMD